MLLSTSTLLGRSRPSAGAARTVFRPDEEALDDAALSELSAKQISRMTRHEMGRVARAARIPAARRRLEYLDRPTLERLVYQARLCAQQRIQWMKPRTYGDREEAR